MADKFSIEEGSNNGASKEISLDSMESLESCLRDMSIHTEIEKRINDVIVRVQEFAGGSEYLAKGMGDTWLLNDMAYKKEKRGTFTLYYIKLDGKKVTRS